MTCLACLNISHDAGFARMRAADDFALRAVLQFSFDMGFHQEPPESPALYSEISAAKLVRAFARRRCTNREGAYQLHRANMPWFNLPPIEVICIE
jgi:hypothetical protein